MCLHVAVCSRKIKCFAACFPVACDSQHLNAEPSSLVSETAARHLLPRLLPPTPLRGGKRYQQTTLKIEDSRRDQTINIAILKTPKPTA
jgi:hypothetical protein